MKWYVAYDRVLDPRWPTFYYTYKRFIVTDGTPERYPCSYKWHWQARLKAWRLNRKQVPTLLEVQAERKRFDKALRELGG